MPDNDCRKEPADILSALTKEQLEDILCCEYMADEPDVVLIKRVNRVLKSRTAKNTEYDVSAKWQEFQSDYIGTEPLYDMESPADSQASARTLPRKRRLPVSVAVAIIAAALLLSSTMTAYALGYDVFEAIATWTQETFSFSQQTDMASGVAAPSADMTNISDLQSALDEYGISEKLVPAYIPVGYKQSEFYAENTHSCTTFVSVYEDAENSIIIQIRQYSSEARAEYEKDEGDPEVYVKNGISHYVMTNAGKYSAVWVNGEYEVNIFGLETRAELIKMIDSVYEN